VIEPPPGDDEATGEWRDEDPRWDDEAATRRFGPAPPPPDLDRPPLRRWGRRGWIAVAGVVAVGSVGGAAKLHSPDTGRPSATTGGGGSWPGVDAEPDTAPATAPVELDPIRLGAPPEVELPDGRRFAIGAPGDWLVVGDWDCDGEASPAIYRPSTGVVYEFRRWATDGPLESATAWRTGVVAGTPVVETAAPAGRSRSCDHLTVQPDPPPPTGR
jgi:hypothetical protein